MVYTFRVWPKKLGVSFSRYWRTVANNATEAEERVIKAIKRLEKNNRTSYDYEIMNDC